MIAKQQDEQRERFSVANVVVGTENQWECERVKPGGANVAHRERIGWTGGIWDARRHHRFNSIKGIRFGLIQRKWSHILLLKMKGACAMGVG